MILEPEEEIIVAVHEANPKVEVRFFDEEENKRTQSEVRNRAVHDQVIRELTSRQRSGDIPCL